MEDLYEYDEDSLNEEEVELDEKKKKSKGKKDACYHKVRARYDVWPSAYASGALVKCRKVGAANWGNKSKKKESIEFDDRLLQIIEEEYRAVLRERNISKDDKNRIKKIISQLQNSSKMHGEQAEYLKSLIEEEVKEQLVEKKKLTAKPSSESSLKDWFGRKGAPGKKGGWVDCNTCRKDKKTGKKKCSPCGRSGGEKRSKYPSCRPTPGACGKRGKWGKKSKSGKKG
jgi:hypothetical protein